MSPSGRRIDDRAIGPSGRLDEPDRPSVEDLHRLWESEPAASRDDGRRIADLGLDRDDVRHKPNLPYWLWKRCVIGVHMSMTGKCRKFRPPRGRAQRRLPRRPLRRSRRPGGLAPNAATRASPFRSVRLPADSSTSICVFSPRGAFFSSPWGSVVKQVDGNDLQLRLPASPVEASSGGGLRTCSKRRSGTAGATSRGGAAPARSKLAKIASRAILEGTSQRRTNRCLRGISI